MRRLTLLAACLALVAAGCGGDDGGETAEGGGAPVKGKTGGTLEVLFTDDVDFIDPGQTYYSVGFMIAMATQKPLYNWNPDDAERPVPDLAEGEPGGQHHPDEQLQLVRARRSGDQPGDGRGR